MFSNFCGLQLNINKTISTAESGSSNSNAVLAIFLAIAIIVIIVLIIVLLIKYGNKYDAKHNIDRSPQNEPVQLKIEEIEKLNKTETDINTLSTTDENTSPRQMKTQSSHGFLKFFIKLILLGLIVFFALCNYRIFELGKGLSITEIKNYNSIDELFDPDSDIIPFDTIEKVEYYKVPHNCNSEKYKIHISTNFKSYLFDATQNDIKALNALSFLSSKLKPQSVTVVPFYVEIVIGLFIIFVPFGKRKRAPA